MTVFEITLIALAILGTSFLSGVFGMIGGAILIGLLLQILPVPEAMVLHAIAQMTANGHRAVVWRTQIVWKALLGYLIGSGIVFTIMGVLQFSASKTVIYLILGIMPFAALLIPKKHTPDIRKKGGPIASGMLVMATMLLAGVPGATLDMFFRSRRLDRRHVIATKAAMQTVGNVLKSYYFTFIIVAGSEAGSASRAYNIPIWLIALCALLAMAGTMMAKPVLNRFSNNSFHDWSRWLILVVGVIYLVKGMHELLS